MPDLDASATPHPASLTGPPLKEYGRAAHFLGIGYVSGMKSTPPPDPADHAEEFARVWEGRLDEYCAIRMQALGIPEHLLGTPDLGGDGRWRAFIARERQGGILMEGIAVNSGVLNPQLLEGKPGARVFAKARLRDRIDAIIAHEYEEDCSALTSWRSSTR